MPTSAQTVQDFIAAFMKAWPTANPTAIVMTERVDYLTRDDGTTISLPMVGVIEVHNGLIAAWRDYFDLGQFTSQVLGGS